jgi:MFS transporter, DHA1 family, solute carrier family 18 (vesicular amine transporter), member 1/2
MGVILGSVALGVLIGYPLGGIFYDFIGISAPFMIIAMGLMMNLVAQFKVFEFNVKNEVCSINSIKYWNSIHPDF